MAEKKHMVDVLDDLKEDEFDRLKVRMNMRPEKWNPIPSSKLEKASRIQVAKLFVCYYYPHHVKELIDALDGIPRKDLAMRLKDRVEDEQKPEEKCKRQNDELDGDGQKKRQRLNQNESYCGTYRLSDLEWYATNNEDTLIEQLEGQLEPNAMYVLEEQLAQSKLKKCFSFTAKHCYELHTNQELKRFLEENASRKKSQRIPKKIIDILFSTIKSNNTRAKDEKQSKDDINSNESDLKKSKSRQNQATTNSSDGFIGEHETKVQSEGLPANKEKGKIPLNVCFSQCESTEESKTDSEYESSEGLPTNKEREGFEHSINECFLQCESNEESEVDYCVVQESSETQDYPSEEPWGYEEKEAKPKAKMEYDEEAIRKWYKKKKDENCSFDPIGVREHKTYNCFTVQDVLLFKLPNGTNCLGRILESEKDLTPKGKLKSNVEFELQFNMAVLNAQWSEAISCRGHFFTVEPDNSFSTFELFFKNVVSKIILPTLALYKWVQVKKLSECKRV